MRRYLDWKTVAAKVVSLGAPMLGTALGGPLGGMAGKVLADAFGAAAATPDAVHAAITDKAADLKLAAEDAQKAETEWMSALADIGKAQVSEIGETMRAESVSEDMLQRWWRPLYALELSLIECPAFATRHMPGQGRRPRTRRRRAGASPADSSQAATACPRSERAAETG